jgi:hypothetical protein
LISDIPAGDRKMANFFLQCIERAVQRIFERRVGNRAIPMHFQAAGLSRLPASTANNGLTANKFKLPSTREKDNKKKTLMFVLKQCVSH